MKFFRILLFFCCLPVWAQQTILDVGDAFRPSLARIDGRTLEARFDIAPDHYLYRDRFVIVTPKLKATLPPGQSKQDPAFGRVEIYTQQAMIRLESSSAWPETDSVTLKYQGCSEAGICYPPQTVTLRPGESTVDGHSRNINPLFAPIAPPPADDRPISDYRPALFSGSFAGTLGLFFLAGIGLAFTACMYPLIPIVSGIVLGGSSGGRSRALALTLVYVQGMALTYAGAGLLSAASGAFLAATLQQPWVIAGFALFFVVMALAMFGIFELQLPANLLTHFNAWANRLPGGRYGPVLLMGALSALIVGPCIAPPLAAALVYLSQTGDLLLGGSALYALALGMGAPLIAIGLFGATALPRVSVRILNSVKIAFGIALLAMALWVARPLWLNLFEKADTGFHPVTSTAQLEQVLATQNGKPALLDFYADWCVSCIEFERETLANPKVKSALKDFALLRIDVTTNTQANRTLMTRHGVFGPPAMLFFDRKGQLRSERIDGKPSTDEFLAMLEKMRN